MSEFLSRPGMPGAMGALMDETGRAAADFCRVVEAFSPDDYREERASKEPFTRSAHAICTHVCGAAHRYADYIRKARGLPFIDEFLMQPERVGRPADVRAVLAEAIRYTEGAIDGLYDAPERVYEAIKFQVRWGPTYDPEMILEHGIVHLLRHRRQLERWRV